MSHKRNITLRITVYDKCNFACNYCPSGMELFEPSESGLQNGERSVSTNHMHQNRYSTKLLSADRIVEICRAGAKGGLNRVSLTGGEPLLRKDLAILCRRLKTESGIQRIEITTNGVLLEKFLQQEGSGMVDLIKISFDSVNEEKFNTIVRSKSFHKVVEGLEYAKKTGINLVLNVVLSKDNYAEVDDIISFAEGYEIDVSMLDLVYYDDTRLFWEKNFLDFAVVTEYLDSKYPRVTQYALSQGVKKRLEKDYFEERNTDAEDYSKHGIDYVFYDTGKIYVRIKNSKVATRRDSICNTCTEYCQEGIHSVRLSPTGWMTACQSNSSEKGFSTNGLNETDIGLNIDKIMSRFDTSERDENAFTQLIDTHKLELI